MQVIDIGRAGSILYGLMAQSDDYRSPMEPDAEHTLTGNTYYVADGDILHSYCAPAKPMFLTYAYAAANRKPFYNDIKLGSDRVLRIHKDVVCRATTPRYNGALWAAHIAAPLAVEVRLVPSTRDNVVFWRQTYFADCLGVTRHTLLLSQRILLMAHKHRIRLVHCLMNNYVYVQQVPERNKNDRKQFRLLARSLP